MKKIMMLLCGMLFLSLFTPALKGNAATNESFTLNLPFVLDQSIETNFYDINVSSFNGSDELRVNTVYNDGSSPDTFFFKSNVLSNQIKNTKFLQHFNFKIGSRYVLMHSIGGDSTLVVVDRSGELIREHTLENMSVEGAVYADANRIVLKMGSVRATYLVEVSIHTGEYRILEEHPSNTTYYKVPYQISPYHYIRTNFVDDSRSYDLYNLDGKFIQTFQVPYSKSFVDGIKVLHDGYFILQMQTETWDYYEILVNGITGYVYPYTKAEQYNYLSQDYVKVINTNTGKSSSLSLPNNNAGIPFKDIPRNHYGKEAIIWAVTRGFINGYQDKTFQPDAVLTEAAFVKMLASLIQLETPSEHLQGVVGAQNHWSNPYYTKLAAYGVPLNGYFDTAKRDQPLTRGLVAQILGSLYSNNSDLKASIQFLIQNGITNGKYPQYKATDINQYFGSFEFVTRAQAVLFLQRLDGKSYRNASASATQRMESNRNDSINAAAQVGYDSVDVNFKK